MSQIQYFPIEDVLDNPFQTRGAEDPAHVATLVDSFKASPTKGEHGMMQIPLGRRLDGHLQLAFGMTRLRAWKIANPGEPFPVHVEDLTDLEMAMQAAEENAARKNPSVIETAKAIKRLKTEFGLSTLEAGKPFGYKTDSGVNKVLQLLQLPPEVQDMVDQHKISERNARSLVTAARLDPKAVAKIAAKSTTAENVEEFIDDGVEGVMDRASYSLEKVPWKMDWPKKMLPLEQALAKEAGLDELPPCKGCPYLFLHNRDAHCGRPECFQAKLKARLPDIVGTASATLGVPVAAEGEKVTPLAADSNSYDYQFRLKHAIGDKLPHLRLVPQLPTPQESRRGSAWGRSQVTGSPWIVLGTTDVAAMQAYLDKKSDKPTKAKAPAKKPNETKTETKSRVTEEARLAAARRKERIAANTNKWSVIWLVGSTVDAIAKRLVLDGAFATFVDEQVDHNFHVGAKELKEVDERYQSAIEQASVAEAVDLHKQHIVLLVLGSLASDWQGHYKPLAEVHKIIERLCQGYGKKAASEFASDNQHFGVKLPVGWDKLPVQHHDFNCWECGMFAPGEKLTQNDLKEGWITAGPGKGTWCPKHRGKLANVVRRGSKDLKIRGVIQTAAQR